MAALTPKARALVEAGRKAYLPDAGDQARIEAALRARLGDAALPHTASGSAPTSALPRWQIVAGSGAGVCAVAGIVVWALISPPAVAPAPPRAAPTPALESKTAPAFQQTEPSQPEAAEKSAVPAQPNRVRERVRQDPLSQEVKLLARATRSLHAGEPRRALSLLDEHARRFPDGKLSEERRSARAQALCNLGRVAEGRAEQAHLSAGSPAAQQAKRACDLTGSEGPTR